MYNGMILSLLFIDIRFWCDNLNISLMIFIKFNNKVANNKRKVGIDFWGYGHNYLRIRDQNWAKNMHFIELITPVKALE